MTTPSDPPAPLTPAEQDAAFRPSDTPATPWPVLAQALAEAGIEAHAPRVGEFVTSLEMAGCSLSVLKADDDLVRLWDAPVLTAGLRWGA